MMLEEKDCLSFLCPPRVCIGIWGSCDSDCHRTFPRDNISWQGHGAGDALRAYEGEFNVTGKI
jgi:hypothetical protein